MNLFQLSLRHTLILLAYWLNIIVHTRYTDIPTIGSLLVIRLGRRPHTTAKLGLCLVHARVY